MIHSKIRSILANELTRQDSQVELIASENFASDEVRALTGSIFTNKYAEGRPGRRYYNGCQYADEIEILAEDCAKELFSAEYVNVQPHSGAQANAAVFLALLKPGDRILSLALDQGGHLSHGSPVNMSGKWFHVAHYGLKEDGRIDYEELEQKARLFSPHLIISGASAYPFTIDWERIDYIANKVSTFHLADFSHYSGLIAGEVYPNPLPFCDVATSTTHKTLRGPRGGMILSKNMDLQRKLNSAVFPGTQGGPLMHVIAAKAQCFLEALAPPFRLYALDVITNAKAMAKAFLENGVPVVGGGTESHMFTIDVSGFRLTGKDAANIMEQHGYTANANTIPNDKNPPALGSGVRIGTAAMTTRGWESEDFERAASRIADLLKKA